MTNNQSGAAYTWNLNRTAMLSLKRRRYTEVAGFHSGLKDFY